MSELENPAIETVQNETEEKTDYKINRALVNYGTTLNSVCVTGVPRVEERGGTGVGEKDKYI